MSKPDVLSVLKDLATPTGERDALLTLLCFEVTHKKQLLLNNNVITILSKIFSGGSAKADDRMIVNILFKLGPSKKLEKEGNVETFNLALQMMVEEASPTIFIEILGGICKSEPIPIVFCSNIFKKCGILFSSFLSHMQKLFVFDSIDELVKSNVMSHAVNAVSQFEKEYEKSDKIYRSEDCDNFVKYFLEFVQLLEVAEKEGAERYCSTAAKIRKEIKDGSFFPGVLTSEASSDETDISGCSKRTVIMGVLRGISGLAAWKPDNGVKKKNGKNGNGNGRGRDQKSRSQGTEAHGDVSHSLSSSSSSSSSSASMTDASPSYHPPTTPQSTALHPSPMAPRSPAVPLSPTAPLPSSDQQ